MGKLFFFSPFRKDPNQQNKKNAIESFSSIFPLRFCSKDYFILICQNFYKSNAFFVIFQVGFFFFSF